MNIIIMDIQMIDIIITIPTPLIMIIIITTLLMKIMMT